MVSLVKQGWSAWRPDDKLLVYRTAGCFLHLANEIDTGKIDMENDEFSLIHYFMDNYPLPLQGLQERATQISVLGRHGSYPIDMNIRELFALFLLGSEVHMKGFDVREDVFQTRLQFFLKYFLFSNMWGKPDYFSSVQRAGYMLFLFRRLENMPPIKGGSHITESDADLETNRMDNEWDVFSGIVNSVNTARYCGLLNVPNIQYFGFTEAWERMTFDQACEILQAAYDFVDGGILEPEPLGFEEAECNRTQNS